MISKDKLFFLEDETIFEEIFEKTNEPDEYDAYCERQIEMARKKTEMDDEYEKWCEQQIALSRLAHN